MKKKINRKNVVFKTINYVLQIYFEREEPIQDDGFLWVVFGEVEDDIEGYELYLDLDLIHQNYTGIFVDNEDARESIAEGESPIMEDIYQWVENNIGYVNGNDSIENFDGFLDMLINNKLNKKIEKPVIKIAS